MFRMKTSSTIVKIYTEMRDGWHNLYRHEGGMAKIYTEMREGWHNLPSLPHLCIDFCHPSLISV
jgi:hypothetical protein